MCEIHNHTMKKTIYILPANTQIESFKCDLKRNQEAKYIYIFKKLNDIKIYVKLIISCEDNLKNQIEGTWLHEQVWIEANSLNLKTNAWQHSKGTKVIRNFITNKVKSMILHCKYTFDLRLDTSLSQKIAHILFIKNSHLKELAVTRSLLPPPPLHESVYECLCVCTCAYAFMVP